MSVVTPLSKEKTGAEAQGVYDALSKNLGKVPNFFAMMAHRPEVLAAFVPLYTTVMEGGTVEQRYKEFAYLKTAQINACEY